MSLGLTRDSILNLSDLVHDEDEPPKQGQQPHEEGDTDFLFIEDDEDGADGQIKRRSSWTQGGSTGDVAAGAPPAATAAAAAQDAAAPVPEAKNLGAAPAQTPSATQPAAAPAPKQAHQQQYAQYAGFSYDYYSDNYYDPYAATNYADLRSRSKSSGKGNIFCCLFAPWSSSGEEDGDSSAAGEGTAESAMTSDSDISDLPTPPVTEAAPASAEEKKEAPPAADSSAADEFNQKSVSEEKKDPDAESLEARAKAAEEQKASASMSTPSDEKEPVTLDEEAPPPKPLKGILKARVCTAHIGSSHGKDDGSESGDGRRHFLPVTKAPVQSDPTRKDLRVNYHPMARVLTVASRRDMSFVDKSMVWWQRRDFDEFKKTGRIIAKAMLEGGSEIWLKGSGKRWTKGESTKEGGADSKKEGKTEQRPGQSTNDDDQDEEESQKWWCKFGHSRRGLEHIACMDEGKQRQAQVNLAIKAVIDEQRRQRAHGHKDDRKLGQVCSQYTAWARDLAHAAGKADEEAVRSNFHMSARTRNQYLMPRKQGGAVADSQIGTMRMPTFMRHELTSPSVLDANIQSHRRRANGSGGSSKGSKNSLASFDGEEKKSDGNEASPSKPLAEVHTEGETSVEAIHDPDGHHEDLAKKAAAFGVGEGEVKPNQANMADVLGVSANAVRPQVSAR